MDADMDFADRIELISIAHGLIEDEDIDTVPPHLIWLCQFDEDDLLTMLEDISHRTGGARNFFDRESFSSVVREWIQSAEVLNHGW